MKARIVKMKNEYGGELTVILIALAAVLAYAFWGSLLIK